MKSQSGFKGKGFKFDETEAHLVSERKKLQRAAMGFQDSDDDESSMDVSRGYLMRINQVISISTESLN